VSKFFTAGFSSGFSHNVMKINEFIAALGAGRPSVSLRGNQKCKIYLQLLAMRVSANFLSYCVYDVFSAGTGFAKLRFRCRSTNGGYAAVSKEGTQKCGKI
jgi:hypothetical protein